MKVISFSLYTPQKHSASGTCSLKEFLFGLLCNIEARDKYFKDWMIYLYISSDLKNHPIIKYVRQTQNCRVFEEIYLNSCKNMLWRYYPFFDKNVHACIARDLDNILTQKDAENVANWLKLDKEWFCYSEYLMDNCPMGGGIGVHHFPNGECLSRLKLILDAWIADDSGQSQKRGYDEKFWRYLMSEKYLTFETPIQTRMDTHGAYWELKPGTEPIAKYIVFDHIWYFPSKITKRLFKTTVNLLSSDFRFVTTDIARKPFEAWIR